MLNNVELKSHSTAKWSGFFLFFVVAWIRSDVINKPWLCNASAENDPPTASLISTPIWNGHEEWRRRINGGGSCSEGSSILPALMREARPLIKCAIRGGEKDWSWYRRLHKSSFLCPEGMELFEVAEMKFNKFSSVLDLTLSRISRNLPLFSAIKNNNKKKNSWCRYDVQKYREEKCF